MKETKIGILFDENKQISDLFHANHISIYEKKNTWIEIESLKAIDINENNLRNVIDTLIYKLNTCKVVVGKEIVGIPFYVFDKNGFIICEADEFSIELLEQITEDYLSEKENGIDSLDNDIPKKPVLMDHEGNYYFDFAKVQKNFPDISSKKVLLPFFSHELFKSITILCTHIMPWLETYVEQKNYTMEYVRENGIYTLTITHKLCKQ